MASYQSLGPFISTFASPVESGFYISDEGLLCPVPDAHKSDTLPPLPSQTEAEETAEECTNKDASEHQWYERFVLLAVGIFAAEASKPEASELGSILFGAWRSKVQNAKHYGW